MNTSVNPKNLASPCQFSCSAMSAGAKAQVRHDPLGLAAPQRGMRAHAGASRSGLWDAPRIRLPALQHCSSSMVAIGSATPSRASASLQKDRSPMASMLPSPATPWRRKPEWTALSARRAPCCIGCISISRHWAGGASSARVPKAPNFAIPCGLEAGRAPAVRDFRHGRLRW